MGLPDRFSDATLETYKPVTVSQRAAMDAIEGYVSDLEQMLAEGRSIILHGSVGSGKTHLGISVLKRAAAAGKSNLVVTEDQMFDTFKANWSDPEAEHKYLLQLQRVRFLMIDDLGVRATSDYVNDRYEAVLNARYEKIIPTIITTNCSPDALAGRYERQISRLLDGGLLLEVKGPDGRKA